MDFVFKADEWEQLTPLQRVVRCRNLAQEAHKIGNGARGRLKTMYLDLSIQWSMVADEIERQF